MVGAWDLKSLAPSPLSIKVGKPVYSLLLHRNIILIGQGTGGIHIIDRENRKELRHLQFHQNGVFDLLYNPCFDHFYSLGGEGGLSVFDGKDFKQLIHIPLSGNKLRKGMLNRDCTRLYVGGSDGYIHILETEYFNELDSFSAHDGGVYAMLVSDDLGLITGGRDAHIRIWDLKNDESTELKAIPAHNYAIYDIIPFGEGYVSASRDRLSKFWDSDLENPKRLISERTTTHANSVNVLHATGTVLFTAGDDRIIKVWSV